MANEYCVKPKWKTQYLSSSLKAQQKMLGYRWRFKTNGFLIESIASKERYRYSKSSCEVFSEELEIRDSCAKKVQAWKH